MNRRDFLKMLSCIPGLALIKSELPTKETVKWPITELSQELKDDIIWIPNSVSDDAIIAYAGWENHNLVLGEDGTLTILGKFLIDDGRHDPNSRKWERISALPS